MENLLIAACDAACRAGRIIRQYQGQSFDTRQKSDGFGPVTSVDIAAQEVLFAALTPFGYPICSEEYDVPVRRLGADRVWIVDPLDGTKEFLHGTGEYSVMVGLVERNAPVLGVVYLPVFDRCYYAARGFGAFVAIGDGVPSPLSVSALADAQSLRMLVSRRHMLDTERRLATAMGITAVIPCGSAGIKMSRIAAGEAELYINSSDRTGEWDTCAPECILTEAGGVVSDLNGVPLRYNKSIPMNPRGFIATNDMIHGTVHAALHALAACT